MADKKITELTEVTSLPDAAFLTAVDTTRATGDQNVKIQKSNVITDLPSGTIEQALMFAASDVESDLSVGVIADENVIPFDITLTDVRAFVGTAPTGSNLEVDILKNGVSILSTNITIDAGEKNSETATTPPVISDANLSKDDIITVEVIGVGSTVAGSNLKISLIYEANAVVSGGSLQPISKTGTTIVFTEDALYNEEIYLTSGDLTLDLTGAVKGVVSVVYCDNYVPNITGTNLISSGSPDASALNIYSFFYDGTNVYLNIGNVNTLLPISITIVPSNEELALSWESQDNADNYVVERALDSGFTSGLTEVYNGVNLSFTDTGLTNGTTYYYRGKSQGNGFIESPFGNTASDNPEVSTDFTTNLVAAYQFNGDLLDYTANNYDGTGVNNINYTTGLIDNALRLANDNSYVTVSDVDDLSFGNGAFSWACMVRFTSLPTQGNALASKRSTINGDREYYFFYNQQLTPKKYLMVLYTDNSNFINIEYETTPNLNQWYVVGVTSDGTRTGTKFYLDGANVGTDVGTGTYAGMPNTTNDLYMGADSSNPTGTDIDGDFNRQFFWKGRELTAAQMLEMSNKLLAGISILP